jgi:integrase
LLTDSEVAGFQKGLQAYAEEIREQRRSSRAHGKSHLPDLDNVAYPHWFIPFATAAYFTGMRPGDLYSLDWQELNLTFKRLHKLPEKTRHHPDPAVVMMDLPDQLINQLQPWWEQQGKPDAGLVFPSPRTGGKMDKKAHLTHWEQVVKLGDLPAELTFYSLRHNFISRLVANGTPLLTVAKLAGHKGTAMIEQHYGHLCPRSAATALDALAGSWGTVQEQEAIND